MRPMAEDIHRGQPVRGLGAGTEQAGLIVILLHGRGADAASMLPLAEALAVEGLRFLLPQAAEHRWYPESAFAPLEANEPDLSSALAAVDRLVESSREEGFSDAQIALGGFSQGACLAAEYAARNARRFAGLFLFSGALIGPEDSQRDYPGSFHGMPAFIGGSDQDPWVAHNLLSETAEVLARMGAKVDFQTYPGMGHTVIQDEVDRTRAMLADAQQAAAH